MPDGSVMAGAKHRASAKSKSKSKTKIKGY